MKLYHGTSVDNLESILKNGLIQKKSQSSLNGIFLTDCMFLAKNYCLMNLESTSFVVIETDSDLLDNDYLGPDNYELSEVLEEIGGEIKWSSCTWKESLELCNQVVYYKTIPPSHLIVHHID